MNEIEQKEIEEMAKDLKNCLPSDWFWLKTVDADTHLVAKHIYNAGYKNCRDKVVLDKEEYDYLKKIEKSYDPFWFCTFGGCEGACKECKDTCEMSIFVKERRETAREIIREIMDSMKCFEDDDDGYILKKCEFEYFMRELAKQHGVEVK